MTNPEDPGSDRWHFDRRIPIALIAAILIQTGAGVWWAASISERVAANEQRLTTLAGQDSRIVRLETQITDMRRTLDGVDRKLDKLLDR